MVGFESLAGHDQAQLVESAERTQGELRSARG